MAHIKKNLKDKWINCKRLKVEATLEGSGPGKTIKKKNNCASDITMERGTDTVTESLHYSHANMQH